MSVYTAQLKTICESLAGYKSPVGYDEIKTVIEKSRPLIFRFSYPIFDNNYKPVIETKIIKNYFTREIAYDTFGRWLLALDNKINGIMPYYNKLYESELLKFNPLHDTDLTKDFKRKTDEGRNRDNKGSGNSNVNSSNNSTGYDLFSNTPQGGLQGVDSMSYLTTATKTTDESQGNSSNQYASQDTTNEIRNELEDYMEHVTGKTGSGNYSDMIINFRKTFLNIDMMIVDELSELFFNLY